jgi:hypothetical protein
MGFDSATNNVKHLDRNFCNDISLTQIAILQLHDMARAVFLNRRAAARYRALASVIPGPRLI